MYIFIYLFIAHCGVDRNMLLEKKKKRRVFWAGLCSTRLGTPCPPIRTTSIRGRLPQKLI